MGPRITLETGDRSFLQNASGCAPLDPPTATPVVPAGPLSILCSLGTREEALKSLAAVHGDPGPAKDRAPLKKRGSPREERRHAGGHDDVDHSKILAPAWLETSRE